MSDQVDVDQNGDAQPHSRGVTLDELVAAARDVRNGHGAAARHGVPRRATQAEMAEQLLEVASELERRAAAKRQRDRRSRACRIAERRRRAGQLQLELDRREGTPTWPY